MGYGGFSQIQLKDLPPEVQLQPPKPFVVSYGGRHRSDYESPSDGLVHYNEDAEPLFEKAVFYHSTFQFPESPSAVEIFYKKKKEFDALPAPKNGTKRGASPDAPLPGRREELEQELKKAKEEALKTMTVPLPFDGPSYPERYPELFDGSMKGIGIRSLFRVGPDPTRLGVAVCKTHRVLG